MNRIKELREELNLKQKELAEKLSLSQQAISGYENGNRFPDQDTLESIADFFNVTIDYLLGRTNKRESIIKEEDIQEKLNEVGIDYIEVHQTAKAHGFTPEDIKKIIETIGEINKKNNNQ